MQKTASLGTQTLGLTLLLLSICAPSTETGRLASDVFTNADVYTKAPYLYYAASVLNGELSEPAHGRSYVKRRDDDEEEEEETRHDDSESQGKTDTRTASDILSDDSFALDHPDRDVDLEIDVLPHVLNFLTIDDIANLRSVSRRAAEATRAKVVRAEDPSLLPSLKPHIRDAAFLPWDVTTDVAQPTSSDFQHIPMNQRSREFQRMVQWNCPHCGGWTDVGQSTCRNRKCSSSAPSVSVGDMPVRRLFVGQLRKEHTANFLRWVLGMLAPDVEVLHVESHTSKDTGREKGCAWLYVRSDADVARVLSLSGRVYVDEDGTGREGVWVCGSEDVSALAQFAGMRASTFGRNTFTLPRNCMVVEVPSATPKPSKESRVITSFPTTKKGKVPAATAAPVLPTRHQWDCPCASCMQGDSRLASSMGSTPEPQPVMSAAPTSYYGYPYNTSAASYYSPSAYGTSAGYATAPYYASYEMCATGCTCAACCSNICPCGCGQPLSAYYGGEYTHVTA